MDGWAWEKFMPCVLSNKSVSTPHQALNLKVGEYDSADDSTYFKIIHKEIVCTRLKSNG